MTRGRSTTQDSALAELGEADDDLPGIADGDARPFTLGAERHQPAVPLGGLERIGERAARAMRTVIEPYVRERPMVIAQPLETMRFEGWRSSVAPFHAVSHYRASALKGGLLLGLDPEFVTRLVDAFYGGTGGFDAAAARASEFTPGEERVAARLADGLMEVVAGAWAELVPLDPVLAGRDTSAAQSTLVRGDEMVVVQRFVVDAGPAGTSRIDIVYPMAALKTYAALAGAGQAAPAEAGDTLFRAALARALEQVRLPVRSVLARPAMSVGDLLALKPGDIIPISLGPRVPLLVANRRVAEGTIGEQEGRAALLIEMVDGDA